MVSLKRLLYHYTTTGMSCKIFDLALPSFKSEKLASPRHAIFQLFRSANPSFWPNLPSARPLLISLIFNQYTDWAHAYNCAILATVKSEGIYNVITLLHARRRSKWV